MNRKNTTSPFAKKLLNQAREKIRFKHHPVYMDAVEVECRLSTADSRRTDAYTKCIEFVAWS